MLEGSGKTCQQQRQGGQNKGGEPPKENAQDGANWLHQRRDWNRTDQSALRRILMHGRRYKHRPNTQHGDLADQERGVVKSPGQGAQGPEIGAWSPEPEAGRLELGARSSEPETWSPEPGVRNPKPGARWCQRQWRQRRKMGPVSSGY